MDKKTRIQIAGLLALLAISAFTYWTGVDLQLPDTAYRVERTPITGTYAIQRVIDGDTFTIIYDSEETRVRLIGIDTPETVDPRLPVECFGSEASDEAKRVLDGQDVRIETDPSQDTYDKYGRLLAYAYLSDGTIFNEYMIREGFGHEYTYLLPYKYRSVFRNAEREARAQKKGLWADDACVKFTEV